MLLVGEDYPGYRSILSKDWYPDMESHVALAACKEYEFAKEKKIPGEGGAVGYIGIFTDSLVRVLRSGYLSKETTFADLPFGLDECRHQTPVVSGRHKHTRIWYQGPTSIKVKMRRWSQCAIVGFWFLYFGFSVLVYFMYATYTSMWTKRRTLLRD
ncbi:hypothetical protein EDD85DRAFT_387381 [Armillaria nabsnona]|nr:hypothetical protein EDD85DRAFT_387381 [Armillaria nabsnona]